MGLFGEFSVANLYRDEAILFLGGREFSLVGFFRVELRYIKLGIIRGGGGNLPEESEWVGIFKGKFTWLGIFRGQSSRRIKCWGQFSGGQSSRGEFS